MKDSLKLHEHMQSPNTHSPLYLLNRLEESGRDWQIAPPATRSRYGYLSGEPPNHK